MNRNVLKTVCSSVLVATLLCVSATAAMASDASAIRASGAWIRLLPGALPAGGFVALENTGDTPVTITAASSPAFAHAMIHRSSRESGMSRMEAVDSVTLPPHATTSLAPGGYHVMLTDASKPVKPGDTVKVTFTLGDGSTLPVDFAARPANASGPTD
jgi:periplasmic copper chaperone A